MNDRGFLLILMAIIGLTVPVYSCLKMTDESVDKNGIIVDKYKQDNPPIFIKSGNVMVPFPQERSNVFLIKNKSNDIIKVYVDDKDYYENSKGDYFENR